MKVAVLLRTTFSFLIMVIVFENYYKIIQTFCKLYKNHRIFLAIIPSETRYTFAYGRQTSKFAASKFDEFELSTQLNLTILARNRNRTTFVSK